MIDRTEIKKKVPYGYAKIIAEKAGVSKRYVSKLEMFLRILDSANAAM